MSRLGILEVAVDKDTIPIRREDDNNFDVSLHESVKAGDSFEVSMLLQLGAVPKSKKSYTALIDYPGIKSDHLSFSEGEQLEVHKKESSFVWRGRSLVSGDEGVIPSSCVYSMLESIQLLEFILSVEEVSLPILQKIRNDSSSNDEKAFLFLETINDDPIMLPALRHDKEQLRGNICDYCDSQYNYS